MGKPILMSGAMVRATLDRRKTQTRRVIKPQPRSAPIRELDGQRNDCGGLEDRGSLGIMRVDVRPLKIKYQVGDLLYVRETWTHTGTGVWKPSDAAMALDGNLLFRATDKEPCAGCWFPSIFMPRWASRITLKVTDVRVQRLQDISKSDALAEGVHPDDQSWFPDKVYAKNMPAHLFGMLWDSLNAKRNDGIYAWDKNPWIAAYTFEPIFENIDNLELANSRQFSPTHPTHRG